MQDYVTRTRLAGEPPHVMLAPRLRDIGFEGLPTDPEFERRDLRLVFLKQIGRPGVIIERSCFKLPYPDSNEFAREAGESMERFARNKFPGNTIIQSASVPLLDADKGSLSNAA